MSSRIFVFAALAVALSISGAIIVADDSDAADATIQLTVGTYYSNSFYIDPYLFTADTDAPGMSVSTSGATLYLSGTPTTTGTYTARAFNDEEQVLWYASLIVSSAPQPQTYTVTIACSPYYAGYVSDTSLTVTSGTSYSTSGRYLTVGSTTVTATATSGYAFDSWSSSSGTINSNKTITAYFESTAPITYTCYLYYNANGGSGAPSSQSYTGSSTSSHTFAISATEPTRSGYVFAGWAESSSASTPYYQPGGYISVPYNGSKTLYAVWNQAYTCTLNYDANNGSGAPSSQSYTGTSTSAHTFTISATEPTRSGYVFAGWAESSSASTAAYQPGGSVSVPYNGTKTLYAVWSQNVAVTINMSPASGGSLSTSSVTVPTGTSYSSASSVLTIGSNTVVATPATGYAFDSWSPAGSGTISGAMTFWAYLYATTTSFTFVQGTAYNVPLAVGQDADDWGGTVPTGMSVAWNSTDRCFYLSGTPTAAGSASVDILNVAEEVIGSFFFTVASNEYTVTIHMSPASGGSLSTSSVTVIGGTSYSESSNVLTVGSTTVTATPATGFSFDSWSPAGSGTITANTDFWAYFYATTTSFTLVKNSTYNIPLAAGQDAYDWSGSIPAGMSVSWNSTDRCFYISGTPTAAGSGLVDITNIAEEYVETFFFTVVDNDCTVTIHKSPSVGGTVTSETVTVPLGTAYSSSGSVMTIGTTSVSAMASTGYSFDSWSPAGSGTISDDMDVWAYFYASTTSFTFAIGTSYNVPLAAGQDAYDWSGSVPIGMSVAWNSTDRCFYISGTPTTMGSAMLDILNAAEEVIMTFFFTVVDPTPPVDGTYWNNGTVQDPTYNGRIDILFDLPASSATHTMDMAIYEMSANPDMSVNWTASDYSLQVSARYGSSAYVTATLIGGSMPITGTVNPGAWQRILISIDPEHGTVTVTPVRTFTSFTQFTLYDDQARTVLDFSSEIKDAGIRDILHTESGAGDSPKFSVTATRVFLDTFGVVMFGPEINVAEYFPQYDALRLNIYSFALYGDAMRINGQEWAVTDGKITVRYVRDQDGNHIPTYDSSLPVQTRTFALSNIYVTWDGSRCSLTFVDDRFTLDLGDYQPGNLTVSFVGMWYFTTMLWDSSIGTEKSVTGWKVLPETTAQQMILIFMGLLLVAGVAAMIHVRRSGRGTVDLIVIGAAMVVAFIMLGMWYRW